MKVFADRLLEYTQSHAEQIAQQWCKAVRTGARTPSYHDLPEEKCRRQAVQFYHFIKEMYHSDDSYVKAGPFFTAFAQDRHDEGLPLCEALYALVMMRRHMWLYAEFQNIFMTTMDMYHAVDSINRTVLLSDYALYIVAKEYALLDETKR
jgi:hypothetical protein